MTTNDAEWDLRLAEVMRGRPSLAAWYRGRWTEPANATFSEAEQSLLRTAVARTLEALDVPPPGVCRSLDACDGLLEDPSRRRSFRRDFEGFLEAAHDRAEVPSDTLDPVHRTKLRAGAQLAITEKRQIVRWAVGLLGKRRDLQLDANSTGWDDRRLQAWSDELQIRLLPGQHPPIEKVEDHLTQDSYAASGQRDHVSFHRPSPRRGRRGLLDDASPSHIDALRALVTLPHAQLHLNGNNQKRSVFVLEETARYFEEHDSILGEAFVRYFCETDKKFSITSAFSELTRLRPDLAPNSEDTLRKCFSKLRERGKSIQRRRAYSVMPLLLASRWTPTLAMSTISMLGLAAFVFALRSTCAGTMTDQVVPVRASKGQGSDTTDRHNFGLEPQNSRPVELEIPRTAWDEAPPEPTSETDSRQDTTRSAAQAWRALTDHDITFHWTGGDSYSRDSHTMLRVVHDSLTIESPDRETSLGHVNIGVRCAGLIVDTETVFICTPRSGGNYALYIGHLIPRDTTVYGWSWYIEGNTAMMTSRDSGFRLGELDNSAPPDYNPYREKCPADFSVTIRHVCAGSNRRTDVCYFIFGLNAIQDPHNPANMIYPE